MTRRLLLVVQVIGTIVLVGIAVAELDLTAALDTLLPARPDLVFVGFVLLLVGQVVSALRWRELATHAGALVLAAEDREDRRIAATRPEVTAGVGGS